MQLLRDSLMSGAKYGIYDLEWIINALAIDQDAIEITLLHADSVEES